MRKFHTIVPQNTVGQWVDAFNNNALAAADHTVYLGEMLFSSVLYTGLETICGQKIKHHTYINTNGLHAEEFFFDNFYVYFRNENKIKLIEHQIYDLSEYSDNNLYFLFVNSERGYRVSVNSTVQDGDEVRLCRFQINTDGLIIQIFPTFPRFGYFGANDHYPEIEGLDVEPFEVNMLSRQDGRIDYDGMVFDYRPFPDNKKYEFKERISLLYNDQFNRINYDLIQLLDDEGNPIVDDNGEHLFSIGSYNTTVMANYIIDYDKNEFKKIGNELFTIQRILYDPYCDSLVIQCGNKSFKTMREALEAVYSANYPFPFSHIEKDKDDDEKFISGNAYPMLAVMVVKSNYSDLNDLDQCRIIQLRSKTVDFRDGELLATDSYARSLCLSLQQEVDELRKRVEDLEDRMDNMEDVFDKHIHNKLRPEDNDTYDWEHAPFKNPHHVTVDDIGLGSFRNVNPITDPTHPDYIRPDSPYYGYYTPATLPVSGPTQRAIDALKKEMDSKFRGLADKYLSKEYDDKTEYKLTIGNCSIKNDLNVGKQISTGYKYIKVGGIWFCVGELPDNAPNNSYGVKAGK